MPKGNKYLSNDVTDLNDISFEKQDVFIAQYIKLSPKEKMTSDFPELPFFDFLPGFPTSTAASLAVDVFACIIPGTFC